MKIDLRKARLGNGMCDAFIAGGFRIAAALTALPPLSKFAMGVRKDVMVLCENSL